jgi:Ca-activated chloride channel family protein
MSVLLPIRIARRWVAFSVAACVACGAQPAIDGPGKGDSGEPRVTIAPRPRPAGKGPSSDIRVDVNVVLIPVTVTDRYGNPVAGLSADSFRVYEDGVEQTIARVTQQDAPLSMGFVFDASKSMENKLDRSREGITDILKTFTTGDEFFLVGFNDKPKLFCGFTPSPQVIADALMSVRAMGWTALLDAIHLSVSQMKRAKNARRALIVLSDGGDNGKVTLRCMRWAFWVQW